MRILFFDSNTGASGDMILGALLDAGASEARLRAGLAEISLGDYQLSIDKVNKNGLSATKVTVHAAETHHHRHLPDILRVIEAGNLSPWVREKSRAIFLRLAEAEAKVHGITPEKVHFHEVGAVDSLVDIIGSVLALEQLEIEQIYSSPLPLGSGLVNCAHGIIPVPAPATLELLIGVPIKQSHLEGELVTPTGAAILAALTAAWTTMPTMTILATGYGAGTKDLPVPNLLRVMLGEISNPTVYLPVSNLDKENLLQVDTNIDDLNPELYPYILEKLLAAGALDAFCQPIIMKKGRPAYILSALTTENNLDQVISIILTETSTLGIRVTKVDRYKLPRSFQQVKTPYGLITLKSSFHPVSGACLHVAPEYEDCRLAAENNGVALKAVYEAALKADRN
jgi:uncharacterized protein (TIGR00299 family) protein